MEDEREVHVRTLSVQPAAVACTGSVGDWGAWLRVAGPGSTGDDAFLVRPDLVVVTDGIDNGLGSGDLVLGLFASHLGLPASSTRITGSLYQANDAVWKKDQGRGRYGAGLAAVIIEGSFLSVVHSGDVRVFLARDDRMRLLTVDHVVEGTSDPHRIGRVPVPTFDVREIIAEPNDRVVICTDGLWRAAWPATLLDLMVQGPLSEVAERIAQYAQQRVHGEATGVIIDLDGIRNSARDVSAGSSLARLIFELTDEEPS